LLPPRLQGLADRQAPAAISLFTGMLARPTSTTTKGFGNIL